jgi:hypothetical protein
MTHLELLDVARFKSGVVVHVLAWDFVHLPPGTQHVLVGAGDGPSGVLMVGTRPQQEEFLYPAAEVARKHNAAAERDTPNPEEAYAGCGEPVMGRIPEGLPS